MIRLIYTNQVDMTEHSGQGVPAREICSFLVNDPEIDGHYVGQKPAEPCPMEEHPKAHLIPLPVKNTKGYLLYQWRLFRALLRVTRGRTGRDTVIFLGYSPAMVAPLFVSRLRKIPLVVSTGPTLFNLAFYGKKTNWLSYRLIKYFSRKHYEQAARIISVSKVIHEFIKTTYGMEDNGKFVVSGYGCNEKVFHVMDEPRLPDGLQSLRDKRILCFVGIQEENIGVEDVIEAMNILSREERYNDVVVVVIGEGGYHSQLKAQAESLGLTDRVIFTGGQDQVYINQVLNKAVAALLPWRRVIWEEKGAFPMKLFEYIAAGTAVISTRSDAILFIEENDLGILVEPDSLTGMAEAIRQMVDNPRTGRDERLMRRQYALDHGTWQAAYKRLRGICESAIPK